MGLAGAYEEGVSRGHAVRLRGARCACARVPRRRGATLERRGTLLNAIAPRAFHPDRRNVQQEQVGGTKTLL